jgi:hypothetical protein
VAVFTETAPFGKALLPQFSRKERCRPAQLDALTGIGEALQRQQVQSIADIPAPFRA